MGCANSKESRCKHCNRPYSPTRRSYSVPGLRCFNQKKDSYRVSRSRSHNADSDDQHVVPLNSTTLDAIRSDHLSVDKDPPNASSTNSNFHEFYEKLSNDHNSSTTGIEYPMEVIQDKIIDGKKPNTLNGMPTGEPETINAWELMEGLEDATPSHPQQQPNVIDQPGLFQMDSDSIPSLNPSISNISLQGSSPRDSPKPMWLRMSTIDSNSSIKSIISDFDPEIISTFRKALEELSPRNALYLKTPEVERISSLSHDRLCSANRMSQRFPRGENKVVLYFTTLRGVRKTYEDCCNVRMILKGMGLRIDERDVSMHYGFREELGELLGGRLSGGLPRVFVNGQYIGGAEELRQMHEEGDLDKVFEGCEVVEEDGRVCDVCGDVRFIPCNKCSGSCKVFVEGGEEGGGFYRCSYCNENGVVRCPTCCY